MKFNTILFLFIIINCAISFGQVDEVNPPNFIKTINFTGDSNESQLPILKLGSALSLEFDALNGDEADYYYTIEYFNFDWTPAVLVKSEYLEGIDNQRIRTYENSYNTYQIYSHYKLTIPNEQTKRLKVSGNYMIKVFNDDNQLMFSRKFMLYENLAAIGVNLKRVRDLNFIEYQQRTEINISPINLQLNNPKQNVKISIIQNNNLYTAINNLVPQFTIGKQLIYKYDSESSFWAGNEYLFFENKDVRAANSGIQRIELNNLYHNYLFPNVSRANQPYTYNPDINGNYLINNIDADDFDIESDYVWIHFTLLSNPDIEGKTIHVYGNFNNYAVDENTKMTFDQNTNSYKCSILLKQGFYNYKYVIVNSDNTINEGGISGNFYQTENNYKVVAYYRDLGKRFDRIIGIGEGSSINISN